MLLETSASVGLEGVPELRMNSHVVRQNDVAVSSACSSRHALSIHGSLDELHKRLVEALKLPMLLCGKWSP